MKVIINQHDGTVCEIDGSFIVDLERLNDSEKLLWAEWLDTGSDEVATRLASSGISLKNLINETTESEK